MSLLAFPISLLFVPLKSAFNELSVVRFHGDESQLFKVVALEDKPRKKLLIGIVRFEFKDIEFLVSKDEEELLFGSSAIWSQHFFDIIFDY